MLYHKEKGVYGIWSRVTCMVFGVGVGYRGAKFKLRMKTVNDDDGEPRGITLEHDHVSRTNIMSKPA